MCVSEVVREDERGSLPCQSALPSILTPRSTSQPNASIAVCIVRRMGLTTIATSSVSSILSENVEIKFSLRRAHCSSPFSVSGGSASDHSCTYCQLHSRGHERGDL